MIKSVLAAVLFLSVPAHAMELRIAGSQSVADANYCGDLNFILTLDILELAPEDRAWGGDDVHLRKETVEKLGKILFGGDGVELDGATIVTGHYEGAASRLVSQLALEFDKETAEPFLGSCWDMSVLKTFALKIEDRKLVVDGSANSYGNYFTISLLQEGWRAVDYQYNVVFDLKAKKVYAHLVW